MKFVKLLSAILAVGLLAAAVDAQRTGNTVDHQFIDMMIEHHQSAIEMAQLAQTKAHLSDIRELAGRIISDQQAEQEELRRMKTESFPNAGMAMKMGSMTMAEMKKMAARDMRQLNAAREGRGFDMMFIQKMTMHHQMALTMADKEISGGRLRDLMTMAREMKKKQQREIREMTRMRRRVR